MHPELPGGLYSYAVMAAAAMCVTLLYIYFRMDKVGLTFKTFLEYCVVCAICAVCVAKVVFGLSYLPTAGFSLDNFLHYTLFGGIVFYGGLFGVIIGILIVSHFLHKNGSLILDFVAPSFPLFHAIARLGCLLGGCCYGIPWSWGVIMIETPDVVRFPVQIFESICNLVIFIVLTLRIRRHRNYNGCFRVYMILYAICRFVLEFFRGDTDRGIWILGLSTSQIISLIVIGCIIISQARNHTPNESVFLSSRR